MDINDLRGIATLLLFCGFIGLIFWVYQPKRRDAYKQAGQLPLDDELQRQSQKPPTTGNQKS